MPELPEAETIARDLDQALRGAVVQSVDVQRADVLRGTHRSRFAPQIVGTSIGTVHRRAKSIVIALASEDRIVVTPRFTGALLIDAPSDDPYRCVLFRLDGDRSLSYSDVRRLGTVTLLSESAYDDWSATLGPEPLDPALTAARFAEINRDSRRAVKCILMDQRRLAGVGNIYANEVLWRAGIRPARGGKSITIARCGAMLDHLRSLLSESIALRGTTFRDFRDAYGARGGFAARLEAYGRAGLPCSRCGTALTTSHEIDGRQTVWCAACQS